MTDNHRRLVEQAQRALARLLDASTPKDEAIMHHDIVNNVLVHLSDVLSKVSQIHSLTTRVAIESDRVVFDNAERAKPGWRK